MTRSESGRFIKLLRSEPYAFAIFFGAALKSAALSQLFQDKVCMFEAGLSEQFCKELSTRKDPMSQQVLKEATTYNMYASLISNAPSVLLLFYIGGWVDNYSRAPKLILQFAAFCGFLESLLLVFSAYNLHWPVWVMLLSSIPTSLSCGLAGITVVTFAQAVKDTPQKWRTYRIAILEIAIFLGNTLAGYFTGSVLNGTLLSNNREIHNCGILLAVNAVLQISALLWISATLNVSLSDDIKGEEEPILNKTARCSRVTSLFDLETIVQTWKPTVRRRPNYGRLKIWLLILSHAVSVASTNAPAVISFAFTERAFHWNMSEYSFATTKLSMVSSILAVTATMTLLKRVKISNTTLGVVSCLSSVLSLIIRGAVLKPEWFYTSYVVGCLAGLVPLAVKAVGSQTVDKDEQGRLFTFLSVAETVVNLTFSPLVTSIFNASLATYPGLVYHCMALIMLFPLITFTSIDITSKN